MARHARGKNTTKADVLEQAAQNDYAANCQPVLKYLLHECLFLKPPENEREFADRAFKFLDLCVANNMAPTLPALATATGYSRVDSLRWVINKGFGSQTDTEEETAEGERKTGMSLVVQKCVTFVESVATSFAFDRSKAIGSLFTLKACFGYVEAAPERITQSLPQVTINFLGGAPSPVAIQINTGQSDSLIPGLNNVQPLPAGTGILNDDE